MFTCHTGGARARGASPHAGEPGRTPRDRVPRDGLVGAAAATGQPTSRSRAPALGTNRHHVRRRHRNRAGRTSSVHHRNPETRYLTRSSWPRGQRAAACHAEADAPTQPVGDARASLAPGRTSWRDRAAPSRAGVGDDPPHTLPGSSAGATSTWLATQRIATDDNATRGKRSNPRVTGEGTGRSASRRGSSTLSAGTRAPRSAMVVLNREEGALRLAGAYGTGATSVESSAGVRRAPGRAGPATT